MKVTFSEKDIVAVVHSCMLETRYLSEENDIFKQNHVCVSSLSELIITRENV